VARLASFSSRGIGSVGFATGNDGGQDVVGLGLWRRAVVTLCMLAVPGIAGVALDATPVAASPSLGVVVQTVNEVGGSYATGFCQAPGVPVLGSITCSDGRALAAGPTFLSGGASTTVSLPAGSYTTAMAPATLGILSPIVTVDVLPGQSLSCSFTMLAGPVCTPTPGLTLGTLVVTLDVPPVPGVSYATVLCSSGLPQYGAFCTDASPALLKFPLAAGASYALALPAGTYTAAAATVPGSLGSIGSVTVGAGQTTTCSFTMAAAPSCTVTEVFGASAPAAPGGTVSTAAGSGQTAADPVGTDVTTPNGGTVTLIESTDTSSAPAGYSFFGQQVTIHAPAATAASPLSITFHLDASIIPPGENEHTIQLFRDGVPIADCTGAPSAAPDPCVASRVTSTGDDIAITVLTSHASIWTFGTIVDSTAPTVQILAPSAGAVVALHATVAASFTCTDEPGGSGVASCVGTVAVGAPIDTTSPGVHAFTVVGIDHAGNSMSVTHQYTVKQVAATSDDCKQGGWQQVVDTAFRPFKNQGDCVSFVATKGKNKAAG
jgi:hypothetical protein